MLDFISKHLCIKFNFSALFLVSGNVEKHGLKFDIPLEVLKSIDNLSS